MRKTRAFTAAELLVSATVLIPIMLVLIGVFPFAYGMDHKAAELVDAQELARDHLEKLRDTPFDDLAGYTVIEKRGNMDLEVKVLVSDSPPGQTPVRQKRADVTVSWRHKLGPEKLETAALLYRWAP